jgi:hypothetical protein
VVFWMFRDWNAPKNHLEASRGSSGCFFEAFRDWNASKNKHRPWTRKLAGMVQLDALCAHAASLVTILFCL